MVSESLKRSNFLFLLLVISSLFMASSASAIEGYPGSIWGGVWYEHPLSKDAENNLITRGTIEQGIRWVKIGKNYLTTYAVLGYKFDTRGYDWANGVTPGVGVALEIKSLNAIGMRTGIEYNIDFKFKTGEQEHRLIGYVSWYGAWDLMKK